VGQNILMGSLFSENCDLYSSPQNKRPCYIPTQNNW